MMGSPQGKQLVHPFAIIGDLPTNDLLHCRHQFAIVETAPDDPQGLHQR
jgi:hypothetical protein